MINAYHLTRPSKIQFAFSLVLLLFSTPLFGQSPSIEFKTSRAYIYQTGNDGIQPFIATITNPTTDTIRNVAFTITMPAGVSLGSVDSECAEVTAAINKTLTCTIQDIGAGSFHIMDFYVDGPLSSAPNGQITMTLTSNDLAIIEQPEFEASLADGERTIAGSTLSVQLVRDILFDGNANGIADLNEELIAPSPNQSLEEIENTEAIIDVLFLLSTTARDYLDGQLTQRTTQLLTGSNAVYRENGIPLKFRSVGIEEVQYSESILLEATLQQMEARSVAAFTDLDDRVRESGADIVVLLHALAPGVDSFCGFSSTVAVGRQGDFQAEYHRGQLLTALNVGPDCLGINDLATSLALNMGIVSSREVFPDGGTFSYSAGYGITDSFRTIATRVGSIDLGSAIDVNRFSNPDILCNSVSCGITASDIAMGANAALSLRQTRHVVAALNDQTVAVTSLPDDSTPTIGNGINLDVIHTSVESGALTEAFSEFQFTVSNNGTEPLHDLYVTALPLNNGFIDSEAQTYRYDPAQCFVSGETLTSSAVAADSLMEKRGQLSCYIETIPPGASLNYSYFILIDTTPPELEEENNYYHQIVAINGVLQEESAECIAVYKDLLDASIGSGVCNIVDQLHIGTDPGTGFLDLEALPTVTGNFLTAPFIRLNDGSLISATFQIVNFGQPDLQLMSYQVLNSALTPLVESRYDQTLQRLSILMLQLDEALFDLTATLNSTSDPALFQNLVLVEVVADDG